MRRRRLLKTAGGVAAIGVAGCLDNGDDNGEENGENDEPEDDGNDNENGDENGAGELRTDTGDEDSFSWSFEVTRLEAGNEVDEADVDFDHDENRVVVEGTTYGGNLCQTAELGEASLEEDGDGYALEVEVSTRDAEDAGDVCAEAIREIDYVATFEFEDEDEYPNSVSIFHDGRTVSGAAWAADSASEEDIDDGS